MGVLRKYNTIHMLLTILLGLLAIFFTSQSPDFGYTSFSRSPNNGVSLLEYALSFDGNDYVEIADSSPLDITGEITIEAWVFLEVNTAQFIVAKDSKVSDVTYRLWTGNDGTWIFRLVDTGGVERHVYGTGHNVETSAWIHIVGVYDGNEMALYQNGSLLNSETVGSFTTRINNQPVWVGRSYLNQYLSGKIDELRILNCALNSTEIVEDYAAQGQYPEREGTVAWYHCDEGSGSILGDSSGNGHTGVIYGATWITRPEFPSVSNYALSFNGLGNYVDLTDFALGEDFTIELWVNPYHTGSPNHCFIGKNTENGENVLHFGYYAGGYRLHLNNGTHYEGFTASFQTTGWQHLALIGVYNSPNTTITLYRNGTVLHQVTFNVHMPTSTWMGKAWSLGQEWDPEGRSDFFDGALDEVRFFNRALTPEEVIADYSSNGYYPSRSNTIGWYHLDEEIGSIIEDSSENGHTGTIHGATWILSPFTASSLNIQFITKWGTQGSGDGQFNRPNNIAVDNTGNIYVTDFGNNRIQVFDCNGNFLRKWGSQGSGDEEFDGLSGISVDSMGYVYVSEIYNHRVQVFDQDGTFIRKWGSQGSEDGQFNRAAHNTIDSSGHVYVVDHLNYRVQVFDQDGTFIRKWGSQGSGNSEFNAPIGITADSTGNIYVVDRDNSCVQVFDQNGAFLWKWGSQGLGDGQFNQPSGIEVDLHGYVYVADHGNHRVQVFDQDGTFIQKWGTQGAEDGQFNTPNDIAINATGYIYLADVENHRIQVFNSSFSEVIDPLWTSISNGYTSPNPKTDNNNNDSKPEVFFDSNTLIQVVLISLVLGVFGMGFWIGFIAVHLPGIQQELEQLLQQLKQQANQLQETVKRVDSETTLEDIEVIAGQVHQEFLACEVCYIHAQQLVNQKWLPVFLRPDLTVMETILMAMKYTYEEFQQTRLKRLEAKY